MYTTTYTRVLEVLSVKWCKQSPQHPRQNDLRIMKTKVRHVYWYIYIRKGHKIPALNNILHVPEIQTGHHIYLLLQHTSDTNRHTT